MKLEFICNIGLDLEHASIDSDNFDVYYFIGNIDVSLNTNECLCLSQLIYVYDTSIISLCVK